MTKHFIKIHRALYPLSWLYGIGIGLRNKLFDWGWLRSKSFNIPVICIGNLAVGGTGKTPHTEYLIRFLQQKGLHVATLSRGYKRKSRGYLLADAQSDAACIGDEPYQMKRKFPDIRIAVDENRCHGIKQLLQLKQPVVDIVLLDDAFQHRYVKAGLNILLTDYHRLFCDDALLPAGRLRESSHGKCRAKIVIVTKCPDHLKPIDFNLIGKRLQLYPYQQLFFTRFRYGSLQPLFPAAAQSSGISSLLTGQTHVLLVTGIASPTGLIIQLHTQLERKEQLDVLAFSDHHDFGKQDMRHIREHFHRLPATHRLIVTTEKDAARLQHHPMLEETLKPYIHVLPIEIEFLQNQQDTFNQSIINYVGTNSRNRRFPEGKNVHTS